MALFSENSSGAFDEEVARYSGISLYQMERYLEEDIEWLRVAGYQLCRIDCREWVSELDMHDSLSRELGFPRYYGKSLDALDDVINEVYVPSAGGLVLVLLHYDQFAKGVGSEAPRSRLKLKLAEGVLKSLSSASFQSQLTRKRFITLVQTDDPSLNFSKLGLSAPRWNRREWPSL